MKFPWLAYSMLSDGCFCVACVLSGDKIGHSDARMKNIYRQPLTYWTSASTKFKEHQSKSQVNKDFILLLESYKKMFAKEAAKVHLLANKALKERTDSNRQKLISILDSVIFVDNKALHFMAIVMMQDRSNSNIRTTGTSKLFLITEYGVVTTSLKNTSKIVLEMQRIGATQYRMN